ncbi:NADP-dependent oxidoreductase [Telmatocola sphagniphila]|uniref:NADP-dependent oxidoreductase n=1 Tax=Telmatocola sphagniphila TaxID=1123043 RepID=A0A8E6B713_9BACT|nr:NADP-dependent oxidoreductase [Telmatocola sphagniphila]QVL31713.1 NADP-dependent oxidoreductase [Telmatocola sphagniphila]
MKLWRHHESPESRVLSLEEGERPDPQPGELLIQVHAVGVTPTELLWYPTTHRKSGEARNAAVPGHEFSGRIAAVGDGTETCFKADQEVFGMNDWFAEGATAEFCCTQHSTVVLKPAQLTHVEAASVPIGALTAWQGLFDRARLQSGERVLIHGGSGAVGVFAIQFARQLGAEVLTTASARNREFLTGLGAQRVIDYRTERFEDIAKGIDLVFDTVGGQTLARSWSLLGPGGRLITVAADSEGISDERTQKSFFIVEPNQRQLTAIAEQLASGLLRTVVKSVVSFDHADGAYFDPRNESDGCGKKIISVISHT